MDQSVSAARLAAVIAAGLVVIACGGDSQTPAGNSGSSGRPASSGGTAGTATTGGSSSGAGSTLGGASFIGGAGGSNAGNGGASFASGGMSGGSAGASGGAGGTTAGRRGSDANMGGSITGLPPHHCSISPELYKAGGTCTAGDGCTRGDCGPYDGVNKSGVRGLKCVDRIFMAVPCTFEPAGDYSCFKLPNPVPACPAGTTEGTDCNAPQCSPCGSTTGQGFQTLSGGSRTGFCVCAVGHWECGAVDEYPCYSQSGASLPGSCL